MAPPGGIVTFHPKDRDQITRNSRIRSLPWDIPTTDVSPGTAHDLPKPQALPGHPPGPGHDHRLQLHAGRLENLSRRVHQVGSLGTVQWPGLRDFQPQESRAAQGAKLVHPRAVCRTRCRELATGRCPGIFEQVIWQPVWRPGTQSWTDPGLSRPALRNEARRTSGPGRGPIHSTRQRNRCR